MIDHNAISQYFGDDTSMLRRFVNVFIQESPALVNAMDESLSTGDYTGLAIHAHTMKSQLKYFGYAELVGKLEEIERLSETEPGAGNLPGLLAGFNEEFREAYKSLSAIAG